jgi:GT2 family glycosyltransferase
MFSIIVCSHRPARATFIQDHYESLFRDFAHECILIEDAKSLCEGYTRGFERSKGDLLIFSHDDIEFVTSDLATRLESHLNNYDLVGIAGTTKLIDGTWQSAGDPYCYMLVIYPESGGLFSPRYAGAGPLCVPNIQALDGCFFACRREVVESVGFDSVTFDGFHLYDLDFTFHAYRKGYRLAVCRDLALIHASVGNRDELFQMYRDRFEAKYRGQLASDAVGHMVVAEGLLRKDQLAQLCEPQTLQRAIKWS